MRLTVDPSVVGIVRPAWAVVAPVRVLERDARQDEPLRLAAVALRGGVAPADVTSAVREMYKRVGIDPTKTRPSSEALLRRVRKGDELPRINSVVDVINWCSVESQLPFGLYDVDQIRPRDEAVVLRLGQADEAYPGIRKDTVHVAGRLVVADAEGPFGNPTSDSARTMVTVATTQVLVVIFAPAGVAAPLVDAALKTTVSRLETYARA